MFLVIIPVTSPIPILVASAPIVRILSAEPSHMSRLPLVAEGLALCRLSTPFTVRSQLKVTPPVLLIVRLLIEGAVANRSPETVIAAVPPKLNEESEVHS